MFRTSIYFSISPQKQIEICFYYCIKISLFYFNSLLHNFFQSLSERTVCVLYFLKIHNEDAILMKQSEREREENNKEKKRMKINKQCILTTFKICVVYTVFVYIKKNKIYIHKHNQFNSCRGKINCGLPPQKSHKMR